MYIGGYGIIRFFVEGIRTDQLYIGHTHIAVSQVLGMVLFVAAVISELAVRLVLRKKEKQK
jgi:phosphatidylglycerol:prolipoprotein diacylglycerol transferase